MYYNFINTIRYHYENTDVYRNLHKTEKLTVKLVKDFKKKYFL